MQQRAALVAYEQSNGSYDVHRSRHLGQQLPLCQRITAETPYSRGIGAYEPDLVERDPIETDITFQQVIDRLDFSRFGAVVRVSSEYEVMPYRAAWFGLSDSCSLVFDSDSYGNGALVGVPQRDEQPVDDSHFCARYEGTKSTLGKLVEERILTAEQARGQLRELVLEFRASDREVRFATGQEPDTEEAAIAELAATGRRLLGRR